MKRSHTTSKGIYLDEIELGLLRKGYRNICGVDEAGRGPLAGPVVAAAVILPEGTHIDGLDDSKKLSPQTRNTLFEQIIEEATGCAIGMVDQEQIDCMNIHRASLTAMTKAVKDLREAPDFVLVDGKFPVPNITHPQMSVVGGDHLCKSIAAASIIAKVTRDRIMQEYESIFPDFSFATHKGYPTAKHLDELRANGPCNIHRKSFRPVAELLQEITLA